VATDGHGVIAIQHQYFTFIYWQARRASHRRAAAA